MKNKTITVEQVKKALAQVIEDDDLGIEWVVGLVIDDYSELDTYVREQLFAQFTDATINMDLVGNGDRDIVVTMRVALKGKNDSGYTVEYTLEDSFHFWMYNFTTKKDCTEDELWLKLTDVVNNIVDNAEKFKADVLD